MEITLEELLAAREERANTQKELILTHGAPLVSFTLNIAGPEKTSPKIERAFDVGAALIRSEISDLQIIDERESRTKCGPVLLFSVRTDARELKDRLVKIEDAHPLGRLFDMDVIDGSGEHLSRRRERGCIVCGAPGRACAAGRLHPVSQIIAKTDEILTGYFKAADADRIALLARDALVLEVYTAPKPGLVDPESRGSHPDMEISDFVRSAEALVPYFYDSVIAGFESKSAPPADLFPTLRRLGAEAERRMYLATGGKNTHKGAVFSFGIILGAVGRLMRCDGKMPDVTGILDAAKEIAGGHIEAELSALSGTTAGERAYLEYGMRGIRGEAADGFPSVRNISLPYYREALIRGKNKNDAGVLALLHLIANVYDTCLYKRGGKEGLDYARSRAAALISGGEPSLDEIRAADEDFTERNLSPGGCADLLAVTYLLASLEE